MSRTLWAAVALAACSPAPSLQCQVRCADGYGGGTFDVEGETLDAANEACEDAYVGRTEGCPSGVEVDSCSCFGDEADTGTASRTP